MMSSEPKGIKQKINHLNESDEIASESSKILTDISEKNQTSTGKRTNPDISTNQSNKRFRHESEVIEMDTQSHNSSYIENEDVIQLATKEVDNFTSNISIQNPLSERNIRVDGDNNTLSSNSHLEDSKLTDCLRNTNSTGPEMTAISSDKVNANFIENELPNSLEGMGNISEVPSLQSSITHLDNTQSEPRHATMDYVAKLPDSCSRQLEEDPGVTPPLSGFNSCNDPCSGDEDDDNYLDSSDDECPDSNTNNDEDECCGEDEGSVISTVGSTCSLRSVASEALGVIFRNDKGQTTNQDGSLLYSFTPSTTPLPPFSLSLFPHVPPSISFCQHSEINKPLPESLTPLLKWRYSQITPLIIRKTIINSGFKIIKKSSLLWSGTWSKHMKSVCFKGIKSHQKINHFAGTFQIGRKDKLWKNFLRLQNKYGKEEFGFIPKTFVLPAEIETLRVAFDKEGVRKKWIVKPPASARGTGIQVVDKWSQLDTGSPLVVQRYISKPYLINNTKFDLRIYVAVTSFNPLRIFLYQDGLVRFASVEYRNESTTLSDRFMHLTNYSVNKTNSGYTHNSEAGQCQGHRWTLCTLWGYLKSQGVDTGALWDRIADMVIKTILSGEHDIVIRNKRNVRSNYSCYELFGVDVLLDEKLRPWLLEVNISPSLHSSSSLDYMVKGPLVSELLSMAAYHVPQHKSFTAKQQTEALNELGLSSKCSRLTMDHRLHTRLLTEAEQAKQNSMIKKPRSQYLQEILTTLTSDDVRHLIKGEDELQRAGKFTCIFPTAETHRYFGFLDKVRYYDKLWDAWESTYGTNRSDGIQRLQKLCEEKFHLLVPPKFKLPKLVGATVKVVKKEDITVESSSGSSSKDVVTTITSATDSVEDKKKEEELSPNVNGSPDASVPNSENVSEETPSNKRPLSNSPSPANDKKSPDNSLKKTKLVVSKTVRRSKPRFTVTRNSDGGKSFINVPMVVGARDAQGNLVGEEESDEEWVEEGNENSSTIESTDKDANAS